MTCSSLSRTITLSLLLITPLLLHAQIESDITSRMAGSATAAYYYIAKPGELTINVNLWGQVRLPGRYEVASKTDLIQLLSLAGGPTTAAKLSEVKVTRIFPTDSGLARQDHYVNLENLEGVTEEDMKLYPGDTIFFDTTAWAQVKDVLSALASVSTFSYSLYLLLTLVTK